MMFKLEKNAHKGRWEDQNLDAMLERLSQEVEELRLALKSKNTVNVYLEGADVANFAMIITSIMLDGQDV